jgi:hypothetical protein
LATKAHFSSNWTSRVRGGKCDQFVVQVAGVLAGQSAQATDRVAVHFTESSGLAHATPLGNMLQDGFNLLVGESGTEKDCTLAFGKARLARAAPKHASGLVGAIAGGHGEISLPSFAVVGASGIEATEA